MKIKGIIFDMDGLLMDTEKIYYQATQETADNLGLPYSKETYLDFLGVADENVIKGYHELYKDYGTKAAQALIDGSYRRVETLFAQGAVQLKPGVVEILDYLDQQAVKRIVASSNQRTVIEQLLAQHGLLRRFDGIVSVEDVQNAKPDPEIFLQAQARLALPKAELLVLEDSQNGIAAAHAAEIPVILIPDLLHPSDALKRQVLTILPDLHEVIAFLQR